MVEENMKKYIYMCVAESLCCAAEIKHSIVNQHFNKIF